MKYTLDKEIEKRFDWEYRNSNIWEDAENNKHSIVHSLKRFLSDEIKRRDDFWKEEIQQINWDNAEAEELRDL